MFAFNCNFITLVETNKGIMKKATHVIVDIHPCDGWYYDRKHFIGKKVRNVEIDDIDHPHFIRGHVTLFLNKKSLEKIGAEINDMYFLGIQLREL